MTDQDKPAEPDGPVDEAAAGQLATQVMTYALGQAMVEMGYLGRELGMYDAMRRRGPCSAAEVAARTDLHERWVLEWLRCQAAGGLVNAHGDDRFKLTPTQAAVVVDEGSRFFRGSPWVNLRQSMERVPALLSSFRSGIGQPLPGDRDPAHYAGILEEFQREMLVTAVLPAVDGGVEALQAGGSFVDIGCGRGTAVLTVADAFPAAHAHGWDPWAQGLEWARDRAAERSITNVEWHEASVLDLPGDARFDVALMADCIHHLPDPVGALSAVRSALTPGGVLLVIEFRVEAFRSSPDFAAFAYAASIRGGCLHDGMPPGGGAGLGMLGFDEDTGRSLAEAAGFRSFRTLPVEHWINVAYELRP